MRVIADVFDAAEEVRVVGPGTDLTMSLAGRTGAVEDGHVNMPGGEVFYSPVEDSAEGVIEFCEFPAIYYGQEVEGARFVFEAGRIVDATARSGEDFLIDTLDTDEGARRLGELGIGCNPGIQRFMKNTAFDEKIDGTVHLADRQLHPRRRAGRTRARSTGTSSRTCAAAAGSTPTASSYRKNGAWLL